LEPQSGAREFIKSIRYAFDNFTQCANSEIVQKCKKLYLYILSSSLAPRFGFTYTEAGFSCIEEEKYRRTHTPSGYNFYSFLMETTIFFLEKGVQVFDTGNFMGFFHHDDSYTKFLADYNYIKQNSVYLPNPEAGNLIISDYLTRCQETIDDGTAITKKLSSLRKNSEALSINRMLNEVQTIKTKYLVSYASKAPRDPPFSLLIHGTSSIGKSSITRKCFSVAAKVLKLTDSHELIYTRSSGEKHWNGYHSNQWGLLLDDIAFLKPSIAAQGDTSIMDLLQIINTVAFMPEQAAIEDKGTTPLLSKVVLATTNQRNLNAHLYFATPAAVLRRFPFVVDVIVKEEFCVENTTMLDSDKMAAHRDNFGIEAEAWLFTVSKVQVTGKAVVTTPFLDKVEAREFYPWLAKAVAKHESHSKMIKRVMNDTATTMCEHYRFGKCHECTPHPSEHEKFIAEQSKSDTPEKAIIRSIGSEFDDITTLIPQSGDTQGELPKTTYIKPWFYNMLWYVGYPMITPYYAIKTIWQIPKTIYFKIDSFSLWNAYTLYSDITSRVCASAHAQYTTYYTTMEPTFKSMRDLGNEVKQSYVKHPFLLSAAILSLAAAYTSYKYANRLKAQGASGSSPIPMNEEKVNIYHNTGLIRSPLPQSPHPKLQDTYDQALLTLSKCVLNLLIFDENSETDYTTVNLIAVGGCDYVTTSHAFRDGRSKFQCSLIGSPKEKGVTSNIQKFSLTLDDIHIHPTDDICVIRILSGPPRFSLLNAFSDDDFSKLKHPGNLLHRNDKGVLTPYPVSCVQIGKDESYRAVGINFKFISQPEYYLKNSTTFQGLCGALICARSKTNGITLVGIHTAGQGIRARGYRVTKAFILEAKKSIKTPDVSLASEIELSVPSVTVNLTDSVHLKSPIRFREEGVATIYGSIQGARAAPKSMVCETLIAQSVQKNMDLHTTSVAPNMKSPHAKHHALAAMLAPVDMDSTILNKCMSAYVRDIVRSLPSNQWALLHPYDISTVVNGAAGVTYVDSLNFNTSMGFPYNCSKRGWLEPIPPTALAPDGKMFKQEILDEMEKLENTYSEGYRGNVIFKAHLKDEPISERKAKIGKVRVFAGAPIAYSLLMRKYFLPFVRVMQNNKFVFECAVGTNAMSDEWEEILKYVTQFGESLIAGDFGEYDKRMAAKLVRSCFQIFIELALHARKYQEGIPQYSDEDIKIMQGLATDTSFPIVDFFGELIQFYCSNPSGHPLTVIINCLANSLYMRYAFHEIMQDSPFDLSDFQSLVALLTYGDDNVMNISPEIPQFNHTSIQEEMKKISVDYTMPDKVSDSRPYMKIEEVDFLKRRFVYDEKYKFVMCPLEFKSISKMLNIHVASKVVTQEEQMVDIIQAANREFFFHGSEVFDRRHKELLEVIEECHLSHYFTKQPLLTAEKIWSSVRPKSQG
jgi:hypothetical protein